MQVYLLKDLPGKGKKGDIIDVNDGFGRNYVIKNKIGTTVDNSVLARVKAAKESAAFRTEQEIKEARELAARLGQTTVVVEAAMGNGGKMFGSITAADIETRLIEQDIFIDKKHIRLSEPIKATGSYNITCKLPHGIEAQVAVQVRSNSEGKK